MKVLLSEMTWEEAEEAFERTKTAILPTGSVEQHGPGLGVGADWVVAQELAKRVGEKTGAIVLPVLPFGYAEYHMDFPGTLYLEKETMFNVLMNVIRCLHKWGIKRIFFMNGHGGNLSILQSVIIRMRRLYGIVGAVGQWFTILSEVEGHVSETHGGVVEMSLCLALNPNMVRQDRAYVPAAKNLTEKIKTVNLATVDFEGSPFNIFVRTKDVTDSGSVTEQIDAEAVTDFSMVSPELGERAYEKLTTIITNFIKEFEKVELFTPEPE